MAEKTVTYECNEPASEETVRILLERFPNMPSDYVSWLRRTDGCEGFVSQDQYLILWRAREIESFNKEYEVEQYASGLILIGSSGGGEGYAFDTRITPWAVVRVPFIGMDLRYVITIGESFTEFLSKLSSESF